MKDSIKAALEHRLLPFFLAFLAMALTAPSLRVGWQVDDYVQRAIFLDPPGLPEIDRSFWDLFAFVGEGWTSDPAGLPWWAPDDLRLAFFRPLSGLTHALDYALWPDRPELMHLHSLLWLGAVVAVAGLFYRRILAPGSAAVAGLAALAFAVDDAHAFPAIWIANRNALVSMLFGLLTLIAYDRWRRDGWRAGAVAAPGLFLLALLAGEAAVACGAYLAAYALFLDRGPWQRRVLALGPSAAAGAVWWGLFKVLGFGANASAMYVDPGAQPVRFALPDMRGHGGSDAPPGPYTVEGLAGDVVALADLLGIADRWPLFPLAIRFMASSGENGVPASRIGLEKSSGGNSGAKLAENSGPGEFFAELSRPKLFLAILDFVLLLQNFVWLNRLSVLEAKTARKIPPRQDWRPKAGDFVPGNRIGGQERAISSPGTGLAAKRARKIARSQLWPPR